MEKKVKNSLNIIFDSQPVYGDHDKSIKKKIKLFVGKLNINFQGRNKSKENTAYKLLSLIMLDSAVRVTRKYYPQTLLGECKYEI